MNFCVAIVLAMVFFASQPGRAQSESEYIHEPHISTRVMGMGGAYTAVADDYQALYYNAAGLPRLAASQFVGDIEVGGTPSILGFYNSLTGAGTNPTNLQNTLYNNLGSHFSSRVGVGATLVKASGWGIGIQPLDLTIEADIDAVAGLTLGVVAYQDTTIQYGIGWNVDANKNISIGIAPKVVYRGYINKALTVFDLVSSSSLFRAQDASEGLTVDADLGVLYTVPIPADGWLAWLKYAKPTFGVAVRNMVDEGFFMPMHLYSPQTLGTPTNLGRRIDIGSRFDLPEFWVFKPKFMFDEHDIGYQYYTFTKGMHTGVELLWKAFGWLNGGYRIGISEGYFTAGISAELGAFLLDVVTYSEEIGTSNSPRASQRYMAQLSVDI